ncbi:SGNH/GDSL hydrolase family protein [Gryllotalpicola protaetiae]|uniref:SGNH/GDSL hydrolase family protein n=1 Tax=Gryllotalpicola protaetiae TaxID=2419771 RepID=A0A387BME4_9MICO|nr:SGNH/GDSL hydrolase family protein [Gryllotalpicola protaetiae]AYG05375.1 SGNH/GDSL hydrolase family protein [Gryllotalpicola protaetiae]
MSADGSPYVAMGSSFAAGPGIMPRTPRSPRAAGRSERNYAHLLAARLGLRLDDRTFSGATVAQIAGVAVGQRRPPQVEAVGGATRLVTITAGGNDLGFLPRLTFASLPAPLRLPRWRRRVAELGDPRAVDDAFDALGSDLAALCQTIRRRSDAVIVLTDYLTILPFEPERDVAPMPVEIRDWGQGVAARLSGVIAAVAESEGAIFTALADASRDHHAWAPSPWTSRFHLSLRGGAPYHPNAAGMEAAARLVEAALQPHRDRLGLTA